MNKKKENKTFSQPKKPKEDKDREHLDGCLCDIPPEADQTTIDEELPPTTGGVEQ